MRKLQLAEELFLSVFFNCCRT